MGCAFCASGINGCVRNLTAAEILAQVYVFNSMLVKEGKQVSRIVVMGSGEPMLNFEAVIGALQFLHQENTLYMSYRNMTISTCGIIPGIEKAGSAGHSHQPGHLAACGRARTAHGADACQQGLSLPGSHPGRPRPMWGIPAGR